MSILIIAAAATLTMASTVPVDPASAGAEAVQVEALVGPDGKTLTCQQVTLKGAAASTAPCDMLKGRTWNPAKLRNGKRSYAVYRDVLRPGPRSSGAATPDLTIKASAMPGGRTGPVTVPMVLYIDQAGAIAQCDGQPGTDPSFAGSACDVLVGQTFKPMTTPVGKPIDYVTTAVVRFVLAAG